MSWRSLSSSSSKDVFKTSSRRLDEDEYILINHTSSKDVLVKTYIFVLYIRLQDVFKTFSRRLQDVSKTYSRRLFKMSSRRPQNVFKTSRKYVFKTSSRRFEDVSSSWTVFVNKSLRSIQHVCKTYCKDRCLQKDSPRSHFWEIYGKCTKFERVIKVFQVLVFQFITPFSGCI